MYFFSYREKNVIKLEVLEKENIKSGKDALLYLQKNKKTPIMLYEIIQKKNYRNLFKHFNISLPKTISILFLAKNYYPFLNIYTKQDLKKIITLLKKGILKGNVSMLGVKIDLHYLLNFVMDQLPYKIFKNLSFEFLISSMDSSKEFENYRPSKETDLCEKIQDDDFIVKSSHKKLSYEFYRLNECEVTIEIPKYTITNYDNTRVGTFLSSVTSFVLEVKGINFMGIDVIIMKIIRTLTWLRSKSKRYGVKIIKNRNSYVEEYLVNGKVIGSALFKNGYPHEIIYILAALGGIYPHQYPPISSSRMITLENKLINIEVHLEFNIFEEISIFFHEKNLK